MKGGIPPLWGACNLIGDALTYPAPLPDTLLVELGRYASTWACIEQDIKIDIMAMLNRDDPAAPLESLAGGFKPLKERWVALCRERRPEAFPAPLEVLSRRLGAASKARGYALHGCWRAIGPDEFETSWFEQKREGRTRTALKASLSKLRELNTNLIKLAQDTARFIDSYHPPHTARMATPARTKLTITLTRKAPPEVG